jgi:ADP-ribose pyrophosphatase
MDRLIKSTPVFEGKILKLRVDEVETSDGHRGTREVVETRGAVAVVCVHDGDLVLVRQYRQAVGVTLLEIPAGIVEADESPEDAASRELVEEVGLRPKRLEHLVRYFASPGFTDHRLDIYFTDDVEETETNPDEGEVIEIVRHPFSDIRGLMQATDVRDAKTLLGLALVALRS